MELNTESEIIGTTLQTQWYCMTVISNPSIPLRYVLVLTKIGKNEPLWNDPAMLML